MRCWGASWGRRDLDNENGFLGGIISIDLSSTEPVASGSCGPTTESVTVQLVVQESAWVLFWVLFSFIWAWRLASWVWRRIEEIRRKSSGLGAAIGNTPLIKLSKLVPKGGAPVWAKLEFCSPGGSVKDRIAWSMLEEAERRGEVAPGKTTIVEATSGNTGVSVAMACAAMGYRCVLTMPRALSMTERYMLCRAHGAQICLSDPETGAAGYVRLAEEIASSTPNAYLLRQFENEANWLAHYEGTGPEIWEQTKGRVTHFVAGVGTAGTLVGCSRFLKRKRAGIRTLCVEALESRVVAGLDTIKPVSHGLVGISAGFYPPMLPRDDPSLYSLIDQFAAVSSSDGIEYAKKLAVTEGVLVGPSSGAAAKAALDLAATLTPDDLVVVIFPSSGERYLQHPLFDRIREEAKKKLPDYVFPTPGTWR